jgi:hypothetical protein
MAIQTQSRKTMKLLIMCPGKIPGSTSDIECFSEVINYYLPKALSKAADTTTITIPAEDGDNLRHVFSTMEVDGYDAIITLGLRFYSKISAETTKLLRSRFNGLFCQVHDGSRLNYDPVNITFTFKDDTERMAVNAGWYRRHVDNNVYMGWASDPEINRPQQSATDLRILVDHTNYGVNETDLTAEILTQIKQFVESSLWRCRYQSVSVRRFDSGQVVDVDFSNLAYEKYDRSKTMPLTVISSEHSAAHVFCVTHPESVGLVTLETATAGALVVAPRDFIPNDRLKTIRHYEWHNTINWQHVLDNIDIEASRAMAMSNSWATMAENIVAAVEKRLANEQS